MVRSLAPLTALFVLTLPASACFEDTALEDSITEAAGTAADSNSDSDSDTGEQAADCEMYCNFNAACDDDFPQYTTIGPCLSVCDAIPLGNMGDQTGNTVGCRTFYAIQAGENTEQKEQFCLNSGPMGNDACGGPCESFCAIAAVACAGGNEAFPDTITCLAECAMWDTEVVYNANVMEDDNYACRLKHLTYATVDPLTHCQHVQTDSAVCVTPDP